MSGSRALRAAAARVGQHAAVEQVRDQLDAFGDWMAAKTSFFIAAGEPPPR